MRPEFENHLLFYGNHEEAKEKALGDFLEKILGKNFKNHPDFLEIKNEVISIADVRGIKNWAARAPLFGDKKALLVRNIECLSREAAPAMLKFLEDPTPSTALLATSSDIKKVLPTIKSRFVLRRFWVTAAKSGAEPEVKKLSALARGARDKEVKKILEEESFEKILGSALAQASGDLRKSCSLPGVLRLEKLLKIKAALYDPTINKRLLCEYFMMVL